MKIEEALGTGRRKTAVASVRLRKGTGVITVNDREFDNYFCVAEQRRVAKAALTKAGMLSNYDIIVRCAGGGVDSQAAAMNLGVARALCLEDPALRPDLKASGYLRRDPRKKERKKYGHAGARKSFQFSKR